jgi:hypothetical protein
MQLFSQKGLQARAGFAPWLSRTAMAVAVGAGLSLAASTASAQIVYSGVVDLEIPLSTNGLYVNVVTGANNLPAPGTGGSTVPGWDINLWSTGGLGFFSPGGLPTAGAYVVTSPGFAANLAPGSFIDGASLFGSGSSAAANATQWNLNSSDNLFGFRFVNEASGTLHYGWGRISLGDAVNGADRMLMEYAFELTPNTGIQAGVIPEPGTYALMALGLGVLLAARRRIKS